MKAFNYILAALIIVFLCRYIWEYIDPWLGIAVIVAGIYVTIYKLLKLQKNEKLD